MSSSLELKGEAAEVVLGEAQAVLAMVSDENRRARLADLIAAVADGEVADEDADALSELLELGLQTGRVRALYGPGGEQAALKVFRRLPRGQGARRLGARGHRSARLARRQAARERADPGDGPRRVPRHPRRRGPRAVRPPRPAGSTTDRRGDLARRPTT